MSEREIKLPPLPQFLSHLSYRERNAVREYATLVAVADAVRYRLLRRGQEWSVIDGVGDILRADELDAAIDRALARHRKDSHE